MRLVVFLFLCNLTTILAASGIIFQTWRLRRLRSVRWLLVISGSFIVASISAASIFLSPAFEDKVFFFRLYILSTVFLAPIWLCFVSSTFDRWAWLHRKAVLAAIFAPCVLNFLVAVSPAFGTHLFTNLQPYTYEDLSVVKFDFGPWYTPFYTWSIFLLVLSYGLAVNVFYRESGRRRWQVVILHAGVAAAIIQSFVSSFSAELHVLDWLMANSQMLLFTQLGILFAMLRYGLLSLVPLAAEQTFEGLPDPVFVIDDRARLMAANERAREVFELPEKFLGRDFTNVLPRVEMNSGEFEFTNQSGTKRHFSLVVESIGRGQHGSSGRILFFRDIDMQKKAQRELQSDLEFRARLLAFLAHDLTGFAEGQVILATELQNAELENDGFGARRRSLRLLEESARSSQDLIEGITTWVQSQSTSFEPDFKSFEWNALIRETIEQFRARAILQGVSFNFTPMIRPLLATGDSEMLSSVVRNVISNSLRATPSGKKIHIDLEVVGEFVRVLVRDEGEGISESDLESIRSMSKDFLIAGVSKAQGAGLGLMIARTFISLHNGRFEINSTVGTGTTVRLEIPLQVPGNHL